MANSVDPDEMARHEPSHLDLYCMHGLVCKANFLPMCMGYFPVINDPRVGVQIGDT